MGFKTSTSYPLYIFFFIIVLFISFFAINKTSSVAADKSINDKINSDNFTSKDSVLKAKLLGMIDPLKDSDFIAVASTYTTQKDIYLRREVYAAFIKMYEAAMNDGVKLNILSGFRSYFDQKDIWEGKYTGSVLYYGVNLVTVFPDSVDRSKYILQYSSMPGTSRHHWGTDIDLNSVEIYYYQSEEGKLVYNWLSQHASTFGFCQPYTANDSAFTKGYDEEKWHWSYFPLSSLFLKQYEDKISYDDLKGFAGAGTASKIDVIKNYVLNVNIKCR